MSWEEVAKKARQAVLVDQTKNTGNAVNTGANNAVLGNVAQKLENSVKKYGTYSGEPTEAQKKYDEYFANYDPLKASERAYYNSNGILSVNKSDIGKGSGSGGGSGGNTSGITTDYKDQLNDLYNSIMGYGGYSYSAYTPSTYSKTVDTSATEAMLKDALEGIRGYEDFQYDLNADMLYKQAVDNALQQGQMAMQDTMGNAAALTGGYGNSYAANVGNQAYQNYITQVNNNIPQFQQMALGVWQSGLDRLMNEYSAVSQQLANELSLEDMYFNIWAQNEANAANAHSMNSQGAYNAWSSGLDQLLGQYNVAKDYYETLQALEKASGGSGGSRSSSNKTSSTSGLPASVQNVLNNATQAALVQNPYTDQQVKDILELLKKT